MLRYKITPPVLEPSVLRPRLVDAAQAGRCVVLTAPAGHGKTCLAAQLAAAAPGPAAWFAADDLDRDVAGVVAQLLAALGHAWPDLSDAVPSAVDDDAALPLLGAALETLAGPGCLVIDDAHRLPASVFEAVAATAVHALPAECRLVICTRRTVPETLVRAEAAGTAVTIGPDDLVFTAGECAELHALTATGGADLHARTGGWPLAVALSVEAGGAGSPGRPAATLRHATVLADVALADLPAGARALLAVLARLPRFPVGLLAELGDEHRRAIEALARRHPSVCARDDDGWWVVREWLRDALEGAAIDEAAHDAVCAGLRRRGEHELLVHLLVNEGRHADAVGDVELLVDAGARERRWGWVAALIGALPPRVRTLELDLVAANAAQSLNLVEGADRPGARTAEIALVSEQDLVDLVARTGAAGTPEQHLRAQALLADHYRLAGDARLLTVCEQALGDALHPAGPTDPTDQAHRWPPGQAQAAGLMLRLYGMALLVAPHGSAVARGRRLVATAVELLERHGGGLSERAWSAYTEALLWLRPATDAARLVRPVARRMQENDRFDAALRLTELAILEYSSGDLAAARRTIEIARDCADRTGQTIVEAPLDATEAVLDVAERGFATEAAERFDAACARFVGHPWLAPMTSPYAAQLAMQLALHGELAAARRYLRQADEAVGTSLFAHVAALNCERVRGLLLLAEGDRAGSDEVLQRVRATALAEGRGALVEQVEADAARLQPVATPAAPPDAGPADVVVEVLGPTLRISVASEPVPPPRGYPAKLLALLVAAGGLMTVDAAVEGLWPGADPDQGRNRLYGVLLRLRRGLGLPVDGPITCADGLVRLERRAGVGVDSWAFEQAAGDAHAPLDIAAGYTGDVLSEQFAYDDAIASYRTRLRRTFLDLALAALDAPPAATGDPATARRVALARRAARTAPDDERLCRAAARTLAQAGHPSEARDLVDATARALADLGLDADAFRRHTLADVSP